MRTSIFNQFTGLSEEFQGDFQILWKLSEEQRRALIPRVSEIARAETTGEVKKVTDSAVSEIKGNAPDILRALRVLQFISREWNPVNDTPEDFLNDLRELSLVPEESADQSARFLLDFFEDLQRDNQRRLEKMYANSLLPSLTGATTLVDLRAVMDRPYGAEPGDVIEGYEPRCIGFVPVIIVSVRCDSGEPLRFQCEPSDLRIVIGQLQAALKDSEAALLAFKGVAR